jgi:IrrE N-terminal-like domain
MIVASQDLSRERDREAALEVMRAARRAARRAEGELRITGESRRVPIMDLARRLGAVVESRPDLGAPARWHRRLLRERELALRLWEEEPLDARAIRAVDVVELRAGLRDSARRFALAHEIGHILLVREHPELAQNLEIELLERFANVFAAELLVPLSRRRELAAQVRAIETPAGLLRLADTVGVSPQLLLRFARSEQWLRGTDRIWLDVRHVPNRFTERDRRLRVCDAAFDRGRWFLPTNRSVAGLLGSDRWLALADSRVIFTTVEIAVSRRIYDGRRRYAPCVVPARLAAMRLRHVGPDRGMELLAAATVESG